LDDWCGGLTMPPLSVCVVIFQSPGSMPSAQAAEAANAKAANATIATARQATSSLLFSPFAAVIRR
jgi:hypothetical protein